MDLSVNKLLKDHLLGGKFQIWYTERASKHSDNGKQPDEIVVDTKVSVMKHLSAKWIIAAYDCLGSIISDGFVKEEIVETVMSPIVIKTMKVQTLLLISTKTRGTASWTN